MPNEQEQRALNLMTRVLSHLNTLNIIYGGIAALAVAYFVLIDWRVNRIVNSPEFIETVAKKSRPALVFDESGKIHSDSGALSLLTGLPTFQSGGLARITIETKEWLASEPIIQSLDLGTVSVKTVRGAGNKWEIAIDARFSVLVTSDGPRELALPRFRLELTTVK